MQHLQQHTTHVVHGRVRAARRRRTTKTTTARRREKTGSVEALARGRPPPRRVPTARAGQGRHARRDAAGRDGRAQEERLAAAGARRGGGARARGAGRRRGRGLARDQQPGSRIGQQRGLRRGFTTSRRRRTAAGRVGPEHGRATAAKRAREAQTAVRGRGAEEHPALAAATKGRDGRPRRRRDLVAACERHDDARWRAAAAGSAAGRETSCARFSPRGAAASEPWPEWTATPAASSAVTNAAKPAASSACSRSASASIRLSLLCTCCSVPVATAVRRRTSARRCACGANEGSCETLLKHAAKKEDNDFCVSVTVDSARMEAVRPVQRTKRSAVRLPHGQSAARAMPASRAPAGCRYRTFLPLELAA